MNEQYYEVNINSLMKGIIVLSIICTLTLQQTLVASNTNNTVITFPSSAAIAIQPYHSSVNPNFIGYGAQWVWQSGGSAWADGYQVNFQTQFYASCKGPATLIITADNIFSASINGGSAMTGSDWTQPQKFPIKVSCGVNTLVVNVTNKDQQSPAAVIFAVVQDPRVCPNCTSPSSYYDVTTCSCQCIQGCDCQKLNPLYTWLDYPTCGCRCAFPVSCTDGRYFNAKTCTCECLPVTCLPGYYQDKATCRCVKRCPFIVSCPKGTTWSDALCKCICNVSPLCVSPQIDNGYCGCCNPTYDRSCGLSTTGTIPV